MKRRVGFTVLAACAAIGARSAPAQTVQLGAGTSLTFKGFISATAFAQDQNFTFGNGQNAEYPVRRRRPTSIAGSAAATFATPA